MSKELKPEIQALTNEINEAIVKSQEYKRLHEKSEKEWLQLYGQRQRLCTHSYADGSTAWEHLYAFSKCKICGYNDL